MTTNKVVEWGFRKCPCSSVSLTDRKRWLFSLLTTAMHLFGLNWHLQPMEGQMYEITEDTASSWPVPTDVSLYPSGGTGLELPDRKGKGTSEGMVGVCPCCQSSVCLWTPAIQSHVPLPSILPLSGAFSSLSRLELVVISLVSTCF